MMLCIRRSTAFRGYDSQLHFTHYLKPLIHVDGAWKEATTGAGLMDDGIASYLYNDVAEMRRQLKAHFGSDLTVHVPGNVLWHTGNAVPLDGGDYRERQPQEWVRRVQDGISLGAGREGKKMRWNRFVDDWLAEHWKASHPQ